MTRKRRVSETAEATISVAWREMELARTGAARRFMCVAELMRDGEPLRPPKPRATEPRSYIASATSVESANEARKRVEHDLPHLIARASRELDL